MTVGDRSHNNQVTLRRVLEHLRWTVQSLAEEVIPVAPGWVARTRSLPEIWTLNQLRLTAPASPTEAIALAEEHQSDLAFRHIVVEHAGTAAELERALRNGRWRVDREVMMVLSAEGDQQAETAAPIDLDEGQMLTLMRRWFAEERRETGPSTLGQLEEYNRREGALWHEERFGVIGSSGAPAAVTKLRTDGTIGWIEDVYTVPEERGRGHARMLVTHATALARSAGYELIFVIADDKDWPKNLYYKIGFRPLGTIWIFHMGRDG
jgi:GNAT superfamily N-acetyltransferase